MDDKLAREERITAAMDGRPISWLAENLGVALSTAHAYKKGSMPPADVAIKIATILGISIEWYILGEVSSCNDLEVGAALNKVPLLDHKFKEVGHISYARDLLEGLQVLPDSVKCLIQKGSSMRPTMPEGAEVVYIPMSAEPEDGEVYVLNIGGRMMLRRVMLSMDGKWKTVCDNPAFRLEEKDEIPVAAFVGKVVWVSHRV